MGYSEFDINGTLNLQAGSFNIEGETEDEKTLNISGNLTGNVGTLTTNEFTILKFTESAGTDPAISLPGSVFSNNILGTLHIDRTNGFNLSNQDIIIDDELILETGIINGNSNLIIFNAESSFTTDPETENHPADEDRYINGCVRKIGDTEFTFPIGDFFEFAPIEISSASGGSDAGYFTACYFSENPSLDGFSSFLTDSELNHASSSEYWILDRNEDGTNNVQVSLSWDLRSGGVTSLVSLRVARWDGDKWVSEGNASTTGDFSAGTITSNTVTNFSPFTLGSTDSQNPLPISLLSFNAECNNGKVHIKWETATEINNDYFEILRSRDAFSWELVANVQGAGNSSTANSYMIVDDNFDNSSYYYKMIQYDYDGTKTEYNAVFANCDGGIKGLSIFPNPAEEFIYLLVDDIPNNEPFTIVNQKGQTVKTGIINTDSRMINIQDLAPGMYVLVIPSSGVGVRFQKN